VNTIRIIIAIVGILLPYAVRIPRGAPWVEQYTDTSIGGFLFFGAFNAIAWGSIVALSFLFRRPALLLIPCALGFGFLACAHYTLDLASDAQAAVALIFIPIYALVPIALGGAFGYVLDRRLRVRAWRSRTGRTSRTDGDEGKAAEDCRSPRRFAILFAGVEVPLCPRSASYCVLPYVVRIPRGAARIRVHWRLKLASYSLDPACSVR
jgi:hypothetical protein